MLGMLKNFNCDNLLARHAVEFVELLIASRKRGKGDDEVLLTHVSDVFVEASTASVSD